MKDEGRGGDRNERGKKETVKWKSERVKARKGEEETR